MKQALAILAISLLATSHVSADAPLKKKLGLSVDQAREVQAIQKKYRRPFAAKRGELHKEQRKLRRARSANDSVMIKKQTAVTTKLEQELRQIRINENAQIRTVLDDAQKAKFEEVIKARRQMAGSSRDARVTKQ